MVHFQQHTAMFNELLNNVCSEIVSQLSVFMKGTFFLNRCHSRLKDLIDQVYVRRSSRNQTEAGSPRTK